MLKYIIAAPLLALTFYIGSLTHISMTCKADIQFNQSQELNVPLIPAMTLKGK